MTKRPKVLYLLTLAALLASGTAFAQEGSSIGGTITDTTGGVLPGVTVEASSPALIEGVRTAVSDGQGRYNLIALRPGTYTVTFTLGGFSVVRREGLELSTGFSASVNASLSVGSLEETVTVSGASPTVDVQNVRTQAVLDDDTLNLLPSAQNMTSLAALTLGAKTSGNANSGGSGVGGSGGEMGQASVHNGRAGDMKISQDGMNTNNSMGSNGGILHMGQHYNMEGVAEVQMQVSGMTADTETAGMQLNYIPKEGGNRFSLSGRATYTNEGFQSDSRTAELIARGASSAPVINKIWDYGASFGGPVIQDKLWFFTAHRDWGSETFAPGSYFNAVQGQKASNGRPLYEPDLNRRGTNEDPSREHSIRMTWQASSNDKIAYFGNAGRQCLCGRAVGAVLTPAAGLRARAVNNHMSQGTWTRTQSSRMLFEAGVSWLNNPFQFERLPGVGEHDIAVLELAPLLIYNSWATGSIPYNEGSPSATDQVNARYAVSYVTGSHSFKFGGQWQHGWLERNGSNNTLEGFGSVRFMTYAGTPIGLTLYNHPQFTRSDYQNFAWYAQDQWAIDRLTLSMGVRADLFNGWTPGHDVPDSDYIAGFRIDRVDDTPSWKDISPRLGAAYDLSGDGRTALKVSAGRYVAGQGTGLPLQMNPGEAISKTTARTWSDANNNFFPEGDPKNPAANGEMGPSANAAFGTPVITQFFDDDMRTDNRPHTWQMSVSVERELAANTRLSVSYFRTSHYNQTLVDNENVSASDYDPFSVTVPSNSLLPGGGGGSLTGLANLSFAGRGIAPHNATKLDTNFGDETEVYNGVDIELSTRFGEGGLLRGGVSMGKSVLDRCFVKDSPQDLYQCHVVTPMWDGNGQIKLAGSYPLPGGIEVSAVYQNLPGTPIQALVTFFNAAVAPSLGRNLSACPAATGACNANVAVNVLEPNTNFEDRITQLDFRVAKVFRGGFGDIRVTLDLYNAFNTAPILGRNNNFGTTGAGWGRPTSIQSGRLIKVGAQYAWN